MPSPHAIALRCSQLLPSPADLDRLLRTLPGMIVLEVGLDDRERFMAGHIPGAAYLDTQALETPPLYNKVDDARLQALFGAYGIGADATVVVYGRAHCLAAGRAAHLLLYAGVRDVRLLDGGLRAWRAAGLPCSAGSGRVPRATAPAAGAMPCRPRLVSSSADVAYACASGAATVASIRTWSEYTGRTSGYCYIAARGDIPGARWGRAGHDGDVLSMSDYQDANGCMLPSPRIEAMWQAQGISAEQPVIFYCGTGWRASLAFFYAHVLGWEAISVYDGGWLEWSSGPAASAANAALAVPTRATC